MVKIKRSFPAPESLKEEAKKADGKCNKQDVMMWVSKVSGKTDS